MRVNALWRALMTKPTKPAKRTSSVPRTQPTTDRQVVQVPHLEYQPTAKELREDLRLKGTFKDAVKALVRPVRVRQVMPPKPRS